MIRRLYSLVVVALLPVALLYLLWRARKQPEYRRHWSERFARYPESAPDTRPCLWLHAVSVGETRAAQPLVKALQAACPQYRLLMTHTTPTGRATGIQLYGDTLERAYLPYDTPGAMRRFFERFRPQAGLIMETEVWPNLVHVARAAGISVLLLNARLSDKSAAGYARFAGLAHAAFSGLTRVGAQAEMDAQRLRALGAVHVAITGNLKFDITPPDTQITLGKELRARLGTRPVFLCASTREGEEALILDAWRQAGIRGSVPPLLLIVPRHPQRFDEVCTLVRERGFVLERRSTFGTLRQDTQILVGDSLGEMFAYYTSADIAFVGGSLLDFGCQNLIEPCSVGTPVLIGRSTFNFAEAAQEALASAAAIQVGNASELVAAGLALLADAPRRAAMSAAGRAFASAHRGATARTMALIAEVLSRRAGR